MVRTLKLFARTIARLILLSPIPKGTVETEDGRIRRLARSAVETVRRLIGRKSGGVLSPEDGGPAQALLSAIEAGGAVGDIFEIRFGPRKVLFLIEDSGLAFAA